jgi:hypothetical protein
MFARKFSLADVQSVKEGVREVTVFKLAHPHRQQQITIVPTPRIASHDYYKDWVYQPYVKDNRLFISDDLFSPLYVYPLRPLRSRGKMGNLMYFRLVDFPDCVDVNMTRREYLQKELTFRSPPLRLFFTTPEFRDRHVGWVRHRVFRIVGEKYLTHPHETHRSNVFVISPAATVAALNALQELGFEVTNRVSVPVGEDKKIEELSKSAWIGNMVCISYLFWLQLTVLFYVLKGLKTSYDEHQVALAAAKKSVEGPREAERREFSARQ